MNKVVLFFLLIANNLVIGSEHACNTFEFRGKLFLEEWKDCGEFFLIKSVHGGPGLSVGKINFMCKYCNTCSVGGVYDFYKHKALWCKRPR